MFGNRGHPPCLVYSGSAEGEDTNHYMEKLISLCSILSERYVPPAVWGKSGHIQTAIYSIKQSRPGLDLGEQKRVRKYVTLEDGSRVSYDLFPPASVSHSASDDITLVVCPGLANSSENLYIKAFAFQATSLGYRVAVLNLLGVLDQPLTTPRIFNLGSTEEYSAMVRSVTQKHPNSKLIAVGFSLGANIVCKYFGENPSNQRDFICAVSLCQGYDFNRMREKMKTWSKLRKFYAMQLSKKVKSVILSNWDYIKTALIVSDGQITAPSQDDLHEKVKNSNLMPVVDELVTIKLTGHESVDEYYRWASSKHYLGNMELPTLFVNALDDPLFCRELYKHPINKAKSHRQSLTVLTKHGGHLGFFTKTGNSFVDSSTWIERMVLQYVAAMAQIHKHITSIPATVSVIESDFNSYTKTHNGRERPAEYPVIQRYTGRPLQTDV
ncbi:monoacylglycerol lipase ABHD2-like [Watersipora subatra]|uniref:monoacylglycerol lipase ABHD2-like n=1 Tax=Watersipora subatra TaxID=2589382 RepID=UPI00355BDF39